MNGSGKAIRCAIYTRVSTDSGLDQEFNSLDAQYDAASAYIRSQAHARWTILRTRYDDGGFSGGNTDRPALQRLLTDVKAGKVDVIVVYKVDRLTRSLADFAKLVELFDAHEVSFVSVTQQFNTTTSMGRLTLNVLLSFAQFEREVTSERIRDKIAASKRKGLWVGGMVPLGYELKDGKLLIVEAEAERVRTIFRRYLELGSVNYLVADLRDRGFRTKVRTLADGRIRGGVAFSQGPLFYILRNPFYVGQVRFRNELLPGPQPPLMDHSLFDAVQAKLTQQWSHRTTTRVRTRATLADLLFDDAGNPMVSTHATKNRVRYRYYVSRLHLRGGTSEPTASVVRVPAVEIETAVMLAIASRTVGRSPSRSGAPAIDRDYIEAHIARIEVRKRHLALHFRNAEAGTANHDQGAQDGVSNPAGGETAPPVLVDWCKPPAKRFREILLPENVQRRAVRVIKAERRTSLVKSIARGRQWLDELTTGTSTSVEDIAARHRCSVRHVNMTISLAFVAPALVEAAIEGRLPRGIGIASLRDAPAEWTRQFERLGLPCPYHAASLN